MFNPPYVYIYVLTFEPNPVQHTDRINSDSVFVCHYADNLVPYNVDWVWIFQNLLLVLSPASDVDADAPPPCSCPYIQNRILNSGSEMLCFVLFLKW